MCPPPIILPAVQNALMQEIELLGGGGSVVKNGNDEEERLHV